MVGSDVADLVTTVVQNYFIFTTEWCVLMHSWTMCINVFNYFTTEWCEWMHDQNNNNCISVHRENLILNRIKWHDYKVYKHGTCIWKYPAYWDSLMWWVHIWGVPWLYISLWRSTPYLFLIAIPLEVATYRHFVTDITSSHWAQKSTHCSVHTEKPLRSGLRTPR